MNTRSPSVSFAARARSTRPGSDAAGSPPGQSTPRSESGSRRVPSNNSAGADSGSVKVCVIRPLSHDRQGRLEPMRAVMGVDHWPGVDSVRDVGRIAAAAWGDVSDATLEVVPVGDGGPRTADAFPPERVSVGGATAVPTEAGLLLCPKGTDQRWNPQ